MTTALSTSVGSAFSLPQDIDIPRLNVIQKMSQIEAPTGSVTIDKETVLLEAEERTKVIVVGAVKRWKEDVPYDADVIPKIANTQEEANKIAAESDYEIIEFAELVLLIPQTENGDESLFPYPIGDTNYQLGRITVQKDAYRLTYKKLFTFATFNRSVSPAAIYWEFGTELMTKGKYSWYVPSLTPLVKDDAPEEVIEFVKNINANV